MASNLLSPIEPNTAAVLHGINDIKLETAAMPTPGPNDVLVEMNSVGICGSDVHYWTHGRIGDFVLTKPMVLGHESSGTVVAAGANVSHLKQGDRVAIEPGVPCRSCSFCKTGRYNLCAEMKFCATPPYDGTLCRYFSHPADFCYKLPENVSFEEGALLEPLSVSVHACERAGVKIGSRVLICGAGPIGLISLLVARACGASEVIITDIDPNRLAVAKNFGANRTVLITTKDPHEASKLVSAQMPEGHADIAIECSGAESSIWNAIRNTRSGGVIVLVGLGAPVISLPIVDATVREIDIRGVFRYANCYPKALALVASGAVNVKPLITHHFNLEQTVAAFETAKTGKDGVIKVMIHCKS